MTASPQGSCTADVIVVGGGIIGFACAFRLAERGFKVTVLEADLRPGQGSTGRSGAGVRVQFSEEVNVRLSWESIREYRTFAERYGASSGYRAVGYLFLVAENTWTEHDHGIQVQRRVGVPLSELTPSEAQTLVPFAEDGLYRCTYGPADGYIDPSAVLRVYLREAQGYGAKLYLGTPVLGITRAGGEWVVRTPQDTFTAPLVVNAAGAWAGEIARKAGLNVPVVPVKRCVYRTVGGNSARSYPLTVDTTSHFWLRGHDHTVIFTVSNPAQPPGWHSGVDWAWLREVQKVGHSRFPWLETLVIDRANSFWGYYEMTPDGGPILGELPGAPGWFNACGFSGHGVQQAAAVGRVLAAEIAGDAPFIDVHALRWERFEKRAVRRERHLV